MTLLDDTPPVQDFLKTIPVTPQECFLGVVALSSLDYQMFSRVLAYLAVFHFVCQQYVVMMVYRYLTSEHSRYEALVNKCDIYAAMFCPLV